MKDNDSGDKYLGRHFDFTFIYLIICHTNAALSLPLSCPLAPAKSLNHPASSEKEPS